MNAIEIIVISMIALFAIIDFVAVHRLKTSEFLLLNMLMADAFIVLFAFVATFYK